LLEALDNSRLVFVNFSLLSTSQSPGGLNDTEQKIVTIFVGQRMINTLLNCIIDKTRKSVLWNC